jgi:hypothetical protein
MDEAVWTSSPCVRGAPRGRIAGDERGRGVWCAGLRWRRQGYRRRFSGENRCNRYFAVVASAVGVAAEALGRVHLGKIGLEGGGSLPWPGRLFPLRVRRAPQRHRRRQRPCPPHRL